MSIGPDIKEVLAEVGSAITIIRDGGNITGEYTMYASNAQVTKPFIREFFLEGVLSYDTAAVIGDVIEFNTSGDKFLLINKSPAILENETYKYDSVFYKTNIVADILRPTSSTRPVQTYHSATVWEYVKRQVNILITTPLYGHELDIDEPIGQMSLEVHEMYIPTSVGIRVQDQVRVSHQEFYKVDSIKPRRYDGIDVVELSEDTRYPVTTTTTTSSTTTTTT